MNTLNTKPKNYSEEILEVLLAKGETAYLEILGGGMLGVTQDLGEGYTALYTPELGLVGLYKTEGGYQEPLEAGYFEFSLDEEENPAPSFGLQVPNALKWVRETLTTIKGGN